MKVSLIITTYNWPKALGLTLRSVLGQARLPDEVVIADDGSDSKTAEAVERLLKPARMKWRHVWHEDRGVRQSRIKNLAVKFSSGAYLIFIDHDVVLHPDFVADHLSMAGTGMFLQGKRVLFSKEYTNQILEQGSFALPRVWLRALGNRKNAFRFPLLGKMLAKPKIFETSLRGCNLSMFKSDFLAVDGFDEVFDGSWGREDSDISYRLFHNGLRVRNLWCMALQYHLRHEVAKNWEKERLDAELLRNVKEKRKKAIKGFSRISEEGGIIAASPV
jgi:glycosyltransferase involved in cell wall biosynthesis